MTYPHERQFPFRLHCLVTVLVAAFIAGAFHPGYLASRLANPLWTVGATIAGFLLTWVVLKFNVAIKFISRAVTRRLSLFAFYFYAPAGVVLLAVGMLSGSTRDDMLFSVMIALPLAFGASAGAYKVYEALLPSNTSLERTRGG
jgi:hypothetical protein